MKTIDDERTEESISALVDLEFERDELLPLIDRLVVSPELRRYYKASRDLDALVLDAAQGTSESVDEALWDRIRLEAQPTSRKQLFGRRAGWLATAAVFALAAVAVWMARDEAALPPTIADAVPFATGDGEAIEVVLESDAEGMSDRRFVEMTAELLASDRRYHRKMREILDLIDRQGGGFEGSRERPRTITDPEASGALEAVLPGGETRSRL